MPIRSLLVPVDFCPEGDRALPIAARLARVAGMAIELVTVSSPGLAETDDVDQLAARVEQLRPAASTWSIIHDDDPVTAITRAIEARPSALPVIGTGARGPVAELLLGSVGEQVLAATDRPILFVGPNVDPDVERVEHVVVAVSSWDGGEALLDAIAELVEAVPASVEVVKILPRHAASELRGLDAESNLVRGMVNALRRRNVTAQWDVLHDDEPAARIATIARDDAATILVASTARWATPHRIHPHSTVREIVRTATTPVLVVPRRE